MLLRDKDKQTLERIFSSTEFPLEVLAYGSRVSGSAHEGSDLDLVVRGLQGRSVPTDIINNLNTKIRESNIPILVQLFEWNHLPQTFKQSIEARYEVLFPSLPAHANEPASGYKAPAKKGNGSNQD